MTKLATVVEWLREMATHSERTDLHVNALMLREAAAALDQGRDGVIEECAKVCDEVARKYVNLENTDEIALSTALDKQDGAYECAEAIRALSARPSTPVDCRIAGPGKGLCVQCANGNYAACLYFNRPATSADASASGGQMTNVEKAIERLAFLRKHLPSHGTHGEEMFNAFEFILDILQARPSTPEPAVRKVTDFVRERGYAEVPDMRIPRPSTPASRFAPGGGHFDGDVAAFQELHAARTPAPAVSEWQAGYSAALADAVSKSPEGPAPSADAQEGPDGLWMVYYEDAGVRPEIFFGPGAERGARARYASANQNWSCHLLSRVSAAAQSKGEAT